MYHFKNCLELRSGLLFIDIFEHTCSEKWNEAICIVIPIDYLMIKVLESYKKAKKKIFLAM